MKRLLLLPIFIFICSSAYAGGMGVTMAAGSAGSVTARTPIETNFYTSSADGFVSSSSATWSTAQGGSGTLGATTNGSTQLSGAFLYTGTYYIYRVFLYFDTSAITESYTVTDAVLHIYLGNNVFGAGSNFVVQKGTQAATLSTSDINAFTGDEYGHKTGLAQNPGWVSVTLNSTGRADINRTGVTKICIRDYTYDYLYNTNGAPADGTPSFNFNFQESSNTAYLTITY